MSNFNFNTTDQTTLNNTNTNTTETTLNNTNTTETTTPVSYDFFSTSSPRDSNNQACAACKHQRRKCTQSCLLAPYFPANAMSSFLNAHKLFGIKKISKLLQSFQDQTHRDLAARSIIQHANARAHDPVGGVVRILADIGLQIAECTNELAIVNNQIALFKAQEHVFNNCNVAGSDDVAGDEQMIVSLLGEDGKGVPEFGLRNNFEVKQEAKH